MVSFGRVRRGVTEYILTGGALYHLRITHLHGFGERRILEQNSVLFLYDCIAVFGYPLIYETQLF